MLGELYVWFHTPKLYLLYVVGYLDCAPFSSRQDQTNNHELPKLRYTFFVIAFSDILEKLATKILWVFK